MPFNITQFRAQMVADGARPSLFQVEITFPQYVSGTVAGGNEKIKFMVKATGMPESSLPAVEQKYMGRGVNFAGDSRQWGDWNITVICDEDFIIRTAFERWIDGIDVASTTSSAKRIGATSDPYSYVASARIVQFAKDGREAKVYNLVNAFPINVGSIQLSWDAANQIEEFPVTMKFDYATTDDLGMQDLA